MAKRTALAALLLATLLIGGAYASAFLPGDPPGWAAWAMALGTATIMVASMALGAARRGGIGRLGLPFAGTWLILAGGFAAAMLLPAEEPDAPLLLGLPLRAAIVLLGVGLLPLFLLPLAYALTFDEMTLSEADLERVRREACEAREDEGRMAAVPAAPAPAEVEAV
ncbi:MAG TPA: hypothetical protein VHG28_13220 [Longimicrobiaceae bacterium]|nr:hypothetical protein [Longimicrobiaceae bacterium]